MLIILMIPKNSLSSFVTFRYRTDQWNIVQNNLGSVLNFYNLTIKYQINNNTNLLVGGIIGL